MQSHYNHPHFLKTEMESETERQHLNHPDLPPELPLNLVQTHVASGHTGN